MAIVLPTEGEVPQLLDWISERIGEEVVEGYPVAVIRDNEIAAVACYHQLRGLNCEMSLAADDPRWISKKVVQFLLWFPFYHFDVNRITAMTKKKNKRARKLIEGVGFKLEGRMRDVYEDDDAIVYGLTKFKWQRGPYYIEEVLNG